MNKSQGKIMNLQISNRDLASVVDATKSTGPKVGFIGLGKLGKDVSEVLSDHYDVVGFDIRDSDADILKTDTLREAVENRDIVFVAVQTPHDFEYDGRQPTSHLEPKDFDYEITKYFLVCRR